MPLRKWPGGGWTPAKFSTPSALAIYVFSRPRGRLSPWSRFLDISCFFARKMHRTLFFTWKFEKNFFVEGTLTRRILPPAPHFFVAKTTPCSFQSLALRQTSNIKKTFIGSDVCRERIWGASGRGQCHVRPCRMQQRTFQFSDVPWTWWWQRNVWVPDSWCRDVECLIHY